MKRNLAIILTALLLAAAAACLIYKTFASKHEGETISEPAQEQIIENEQTTKEKVPNTEENEQQKNLEDSDLKAKTGISKVKTNSSSFDKTNAQKVTTTNIKELKVEETHKINIDDDTDWSLLEKVPRSDVVVVDRVYKMKSPRKYFFK